MRQRREIIIPRIYEANFPLANGHPSERRISSLESVQNEKNYGFIKKKIA